MEPNNYDLIADLYDIYVPATFDIDFFINEASKVSGEVLELMSGTGRVSIPLVQSGVNLTCVDMSEKSNKILRNKFQRMNIIAEVIHQDICNLSISKQFEMVIIPFHSFAHITKLPDQRAALERIYLHLFPGGTFICTLGNPKLRSTAVDGQYRFFRKYRLDNGGELLLWILETLCPDDQSIVQAMQFYEEYDQKGVLARKRLLEINFRLNSRSEFEELAALTGFEIHKFSGDYSYAPFDEELSPYMIWILRKPSC